MLAIQTCWYPSPVRMKASVEPSGEIAGWKSLPSPHRQPVSGVINWCWFDPSAFIAQIVDTT
jgi:hypothetical protein